jgi:hypothetical protein
MLLIFTLFLLASGAFSSMCYFFPFFFASLCVCFPTEMSPIIKHDNLEKCTGNLMFSSVISPWGSLGLGRELHEFHTPTQIHQRFCHHYADIS